MYIHGNLTQGSSRRFKTNIRDFTDNVLEKVASIKVRRFKKDGKDDFGVTAEELPEELIVRDVRTGEISGYNVTRLVVFLLKAIQELYIKVKRLEAKNYEKKAS